jgi:hypothetical protein
MLNDRGELRNLLPVDTCDWTDEEAVIISRLSPRNSMSPFSEFSFLLCSFLICNEFCHSAHSRSQKRLKRRNNDEMKKILLLSHCLSHSSNNYKHSRFHTAQS